MPRAPAQGRTDTGSRLIAAAPDAIFRAFADPGALMAWLPPEGMIGRLLEHDFREGGRYRIELSYGDDAPPGAGKTTSRTDVSAGRFLAIDAGRRIVQSVEFESDDPSFAGEMIMTWSFEPAPGGTQVTVTAEGVPPGITREDHEEGIRASLAGLARFLGGDPA